MNARAARTSFFILQRTSFVRAWILRGLVCQLALAIGAATPVSAQVPTPESFFGFRMGTDGKLATWAEIQKYFETVAARSDRVELVSAGVTTDGNRLIAAIISAPENIRRLAEIQAANRRLADPRTLPEEEAMRLAADHKIIVALGCSIHASEIGATQTANELLHNLATATDPPTLAILRDVVVILIPSLNPDGHKLVVDWYRRTLGTPFEASPMPWLYHKYAGHDINRDAFMMNMEENRSLARFFYGEWHPQVFLTLHQMGQRGPRFFVPPNYEPIDPNYDPLIWRAAGLLGNAMALKLERDNRSGVVSNALFDYYWPGYEDSAPLGHNTICLLTEVASVRLALPITIPPGDLTGSPRGLPEYRPQINFPNPWAGGAWHLRDIVEYELGAVGGLLDGAWRYREQLLQNFYIMAKRSVEKGRAGGPFAFVIPPEQHDPYAAAKLVNLLIEGGVEVHKAIEPFRADGADYPAGSQIILMAQPFRAYVKTLLERQDYPARRLSPNGPVERPYDVAAWTLPYQMGVTVVRADRWFEVPTMARLDRAAIEPAQVWGDKRPTYYLIDGRGNGGVIAVNRLQAAGLQPVWLITPTEVEGYRYPAGSIIVRQAKTARAVVEKVATTLGLRVTGVKGKAPQEVLRLAPARVALYKPWLENIDEGWTRWLLEQYEFPFSSVSDQEIRQGGLRTRFDVLILPDAPPDRMITGHRQGTVPPEYTGGLAEEGVTALKSFVESGGTLVCLDSSCGLVIDALKLPVKDLVRDARPDEFFCPGSIIGLELDPAQPLSFGMQQQTAAFFAYSAAYDIGSPTTTLEGHSGPANGGGVHVVGRYAASDLLLSGWIEHGEVIAGRGAVVEARTGLGRAVLIGFRAQHRAQSHATFRLLFNAILTHR